MVPKMASMSGFQFPRHRVMPWVLSAASASAVAQQAERLRRFVEQHTELDPHVVAHSLVTTGASFDHRAVLVGGDRDELLTVLAEQKR
jgi:acyl transferase domain-containing protein